MSTKKFIQFGGFFMLVVLLIGFSTNIDKIIGMFYGKDGFWGYYYLGLYFLYLTASVWFIYGCPIFWKPRAKNK